MAIATEYGLFIDGAWGKTRPAERSRPLHALADAIAGNRGEQSGFGRELALETLALHLETKSVVVTTRTRPANPFGL